jgi:hypothetical protein
VDRQIVAIAKVYRARVIYSNDGDMATIARSAGLHVIGIEELPLPAKPKIAPLLPLLQRMQDLASGDEAPAEGPVP